MAPFEEIEVSDYVPAFKEGIRQQNAEVQAIIDNEEEPTFDNTLGALDRSGHLLTKVASVFFNLTSSDNSKELTEVQVEVLPLLSEHNDNIYMNADLFARVEKIYNQRAELGLTEEQGQLLDKVYNEFKRNGIALDADSQQRMREINKELSMLQQQFGNNLLDETNSYKLVIDNEEDLAGLPASVREAAAEAAAAEGMEGKWVFGLQRPSWEPFMLYSDKRELREQLYKAMYNRGNNNNDKDNKELVLKIANLRIEKAKMLGYNTPSEFILEDKMAKNPATVNAFLAEIFVAANAQAKRELAEM